ncbi:hypothetical protein QZR14_06615 [Pseudomonas sp. rhizo66]|uniref:hypothetical protein n=1 Tax=Pseudomonas sp. rhizo66 TaxID=3059674 RepID=UPI002891EF33|nr:hypothetical protein [Pseudomonas sp. rhizo66]MDT3311027.1 hypothetical protein [Pseudomonas sp. rhizo66]
MSESMDAAHDQQTIAPILTGLAQMSVKFDANDVTRSRSLFGNGRMQVKVQVLVSGVDADGNAIYVPADVMDSIELIHYSTGKTLRDGWVASTEQGRFTLEAQAPISVGEGDEADVENDSVQSQVRTFWVSSSSAGTTRIGARLSLNGVRIVSNGTTLSSVHDSSVTLEAQTPETYSIGLFDWFQTRRGNEQPGNRIWNYYLGLFPQGQQIRLVDWIVDGIEPGEDHVFAGGNKLNESKTNYMEAALVRRERSEITAYLPFAGNQNLYTFTADAITREEKRYSVTVNDRDGYLTVVQVLSEYSKDAGKYKVGNVLHFRAIDQHGTEHKLAIRTNFYERNLYLERG